MATTTVKLGAVSSWVPWWELVVPGEAVVIDVTFTGAGEFGLLAGTGGSPAKWTIDKRTRSGRLTVALPPTTGGLWRLGLYRNSGSGTATVTVTTALPSKITPTSTTGGTVPLYRLTTQLGNLPAGTVVRRKGASAATFGARRLQSSFWTAPLASNAALASTSAVWSKRLADQATSMISGAPFTSAYSGIYGTRTSTDGYSINVYEVPLATERVPVWATSDKYYTSGGVRTSFRDVLDAGVPLPDPSLLPGNRIQPAGTDGSIIVICGSEAWELWRFAPTTTVAGYGWQCSQGGYIADTATHPGWWAGSGTENAPLRGGDFGVSASGMSYLGAILTGADFYATDIEHPLAVALPETGGYGTADFPYFVFPATRGDRLGNLGDAADGTSGDTVKLPEGTRFRLPPAEWTDASINAYAAARGLSTSGPGGSTAATLAKVMRALRDYGMLVSDFAQIVGFSAESDTTYGTPYNPLSAAQRPVWGNFGQQLPWSSFVQVAPPLSTVATQGWSA